MLEWPQVEGPVDAVANPRGRAVRHMTEVKIRIGTRGSTLARAQAALLADALERAGRRTEIVVVETDGDRRAPDTAWGEGAFVAAIERSLLAGQVDLAVHSAKDVPTEENEELSIGAYLRRADPRDALVLPVGATERGLEDLAPGSRVGTDSPRRTGFLLARRPDLIVHPLHGNVDTRLRRLDDGESDALVLACAGLDRMSLGDRISDRLEPEYMVPAPGQGAIAVQIRRSDARLIDFMARIDDRRTRLAVEAERAFLSAAGGGCRAPIGALARVSGDELDLLGGFARPDGSASIVARRRGPLSAGQEMARQLAADLDTASGVRATAALVPRTERSTRPRVLVTRAATQAGQLVSALLVGSIDAVPVPSIEVEMNPGGELDVAARRLHAYDWAIVTSANGAQAVLDAMQQVLTDRVRPRWAAIGRATRAVLEQRGIQVDIQPSRARSVVIAVELPIALGDRVLVIRGDLAEEGLADALRARGAVVDDVVAYRTLEAPETSRALLRRALADGPIDAVVFTSGSTVRGLVALALADSLDVTSIPSVCIGPGTAAAALAAGFSVVAISPTPDAAALAVTTSRAILGSSGAESARSSP